MTQPATPTSTYRLQLHAEFTFDDATAILPYLAELGVTHVFCSPILQAAPGSMHGYDVVDHSRISADLGGEDGFRRLATAAREHGLGVVVDVVPNHMAVPTPLWRNQALWDALRLGTESSFARWFDVDLVSSRAVLMPVLGRRIGEELADGTITVESRDLPGLGEQTVVVHHDHVFPVRPGTEDLPIAELLEEQWYRLAFWRVAGEELNYRRFFDVDTLAAVRVEDPEVFRDTHAKLLELHADGLIDGFRIDHPDGLANPRGYLADLQAATGGCWVVAEKILEGHEELPATFECAGTTGYDALLRVGGVFQDPASLPALNVLWERSVGTGEGFATTLDRCKDEVVSTMLLAEVNRLVAIAAGICDGDIRLRDHTRGQLDRAIRALLVSMDRYRAYVEPGLSDDDGERAVIVAAADRARFLLAPDEQATLDLVAAFAVGDPGTGDDDGAATLPAPGTDSPDAHSGLRAEFMVRFAQTCGPVMAKSKEDTAFYRWNRFVGVNEVGSEPTRVGISPDAFHDFSAHLAEAWPTSMTCLSTHDTKRSEDVRARLSALVEHPAAWESCVAELRLASDGARGELVDGATEMFLWQTLAGTWALPGTAAGAEPISEDRLVAYLTKAMREAKSHTTWTAPNEAYESAILSLARFALTDDACRAALDAFTELSTESVRAAILGQKLLQLTMPGVPDVYQGTELVDLSLVDPDNRRPVDFELRSGLLERSGHVASTAGQLAELAGPARPPAKGVDVAGWSVNDPLQGGRAGRSSLSEQPGRRDHTGDIAADLDLSLDADKLHLTTTALRIRRDHPDAFRGETADYRPCAATTGHALAFARGVRGEDQPVAITVVTRLPATLAERGGWGDHIVVLPATPLTDALTGRQFDGGETPLADLLADSTVALLIPTH